MGPPESAPVTEEAELAVSSADELELAEPEQTRRRQLRGLLAAARADSLTRSSTLLVADYLVIGAIGGVCTVIMARAWSPHDVGAVGAISGVVSLLSTATSTGLASTITRFLGDEQNQLDFMIEAMVCTILAGLSVAAAVCFIPGHFGVPLHDLPVGTGVAFVLVGGYVACNNLTTITDPAFLARREVSYAVVKDVAASGARVVLLVALIGTNAAGLFTASVLYVAVAAVLDFALVGWRLRNRMPRAPLRGFSQLRSRVRFAVGSHSAALVAVVPGALLGTIVAAVDGPTTAAYVGIPLGVAAYVTIIPSMTSQALLAELSDPDRDAAAIAVRALRLCYAGTVPAALLLGGLAPYVLLVFGHRYSVHGSWYLRWDVVSTFVATSNYVSDTVLLAREKVLAYNIVNVLGTVAVLSCFAAAAVLGPRWFGPAIVAGQLLYLTVSLIAVRRYATAGDALAALRGLSWSP
jgi:O-antigen/teichoic acid export membrane protein